MTTPISQVYRFQNNPAKDPTREDKSDYFIRFLECFDKNLPCDIMELCGAKPVFGEMLLKKAIEKGYDFRVTGFENAHHTEAEKYRKTLPPEISNRMEISNDNIFRHFHDPETNYDGLDLDLCTGPNVNDIRRFIGFFNADSFRMGFLTVCASGRAVKGIDGVGRYGIVEKLYALIPDGTSHPENFDVWNWERMDRKPSCENEFWFNEMLSSADQIEVIATLLIRVIKTLNPKLRFFYQRMYWGGNGNKQSPMIVLGFMSGMLKGIKTKRVNDLIPHSQKSPVMVEAGKKAWATRQANAQKKLQQAA